MRVSTDERRTDSITCSEQGIPRHDIQTMHELLGKMKQLPSIALHSKHAIEFY